MSRKSVTVERIRPFLFLFSFLELVVGALSVPTSQQGDFLPIFNKALDKMLSISYNSTSNDQIPLVESRLSSCELARHYFFLLFFIIECLNAVF